MFLPTRILNQKDSPFKCNQVLDVDHEVLKVQERRVDALVICLLQDWVDGHWVEVWQILEVFAIFGTVYEGVLADGPGPIQLLDFLCMIFQPRSLIRIRNIIDESVEGLMDSTVHCTLYDP